MSDTANNRSPEDDHRILEARARALAQPVLPEIPGEADAFVLFRLAFETYGIESRYVREVIPLKALTLLPGVPDFVAGLVNVRGQVLSVINLRQYLALPGSGISDLNTILVLCHEGMEFGVLADAILETAIPSGVRQGPLLTMSASGSEYLQAITDDGVILLDGLKLLTDRRVVVDQGVE
jgi:purine-binding chemotaxis protein CheW